MHAAAPRLVKTRRAVAPAPASEDTTLRHGAGAGGTPGLPGAGTGATGSGASPPSGSSGSPAAPGAAGAPGSGAALPGSAGGATTGFAPGGPAGATGAGTAAGTAGAGVPDAVVSGVDPPVSATPPTTPPASTTATTATSSPRRRVRAREGPGDPWMGPVGGSTRAPVATGPTGAIRPDGATEPGGAAVPDGTAVPDGAAVPGCATTDVATVDAPTGGAPVPAGVGPSTIGERAAGAASAAIVAAGTASVSSSRPERAGEHPQPLAGLLGAGAVDRSGRRHRREQRPEVLGEVAGDHGVAVQPGHRRLDRAARILAPAREALQQDEAEGVDVRGRADLLTPHLLGREVGGGPGDLPVHRGRGGHGGDAEVGEHRVDPRRAGTVGVRTVGLVGVRVEQDVPGLDVAVDDPERVDVRERGEQLPREPDHDVDRQRTPLERVGERSAGDQAGDEEDAVVDLTDVEDLEHPGVGDLGGRLHLAPHRRRLEGPDAGSEELDGDVAPEQAVVRPVHRGRGTPAEALPEVEPLPHRRRRRRLGGGRQRREGSGRGGHSVGGRPGVTSDLTAVGGPGVGVRDVLVHAVPGVRFHARDRRSWPPNGIVHPPIGWMRPGWRHTGRAVLCPADGPAPHPGAQPDGLCCRDGRRVLDA